MSTPTFPEDFQLSGELNDIKRRLSDLETAARLPLSSIGSGGLTVKNDGQITFLDASGNVLITIDKDGMMTFEPDGSTMSIFDDTQLQFNRSDGSRQLEITPAGGLKIYAANGTTEQVVLDGDGLEVEGGVVRAMDVSQEISSGNNASLTTSLSTLGSNLVLTKPSWAQEALIQSVGQIRVTDDAGGTAPYDIIGQVTVDVGGSPTSRSLQVTIDTEGRSAAVTVFNQKLISSPGSSVTSGFEARVSAGSNSINAWSHSVIVTWLR